MDTKKNHDSKGLFSTIKTTFSRLRSDSKSKEKLPPLPDAIQRLSLTSRDADGKKDTNGTKDVIGENDHGQRHSVGQTKRQSTTDRESVNDDTLSPRNSFPNNILRRGSIRIFKLDDIQILKLVGRGGFAKVYQIKRKSDSKIFALKVMRKDHVRKTKQVNNVMNEKSLQQLARDTQFIVRTYSSFQDPVHLFIVQEYLPGGDLFNFIREYGVSKTNQYMSNPNAQFYASEILLGLSFLHSLRIVYRDLKPENILFARDGHIRIADLGFAKRIEETTTTFCGTPSYLAPEVLQRQAYGLEVDWWTFGVLVFQLCSGCSPFQEPHPSKTFARILNCAIRWPPDPQQYFTNDAFDLIMRLFEMDPRKRLREGEIRSHEWFSAIDFAKMDKKAVPAPVDILVKIQMLAGPDLGSYEAEEVEVELSTGDYVESSERIFRDF